MEDKNYMPPVLIYERPCSNCGSIEFNVCQERRLGGAKWEECRRCGAKRFTPDTTPEQKQEFTKKAITLSTEAIKKLSVAFHNFGDAAKNLAKTLEEINNDKN